uniref:Uncharacterized protein n=1 Tax=Zea mays TaxID=4577 RepID=C0PAE7_MAIZE|nr:unknown [Zea mays]
MAATKLNEVGLAEASKFFCSFNCCVPKLCSGHTVRIFNKLLTV